MGYAKVPLKNPHEYLKKNSRETNVNTEVKQFRRRDCEHKKPPVPKRDDAPLIFNEGDKRNFIELNRLNALRKPARRPAKKYADTVHGDTFFLEFSGLVPKFIKKEEFGKTPKYLVQRKKDLDFSTEAYEKSTSKLIQGKKDLDLSTEAYEKSISKLIQLSQEERRDLLEGLRTNWQYLYTKYVTLPVKIDTKSKKSRKMELERQLDLLEHDIYFLEKNEDNDIYILPQ